MPPFHGGGDMIESVTFEKTTYAGLPNKFEAGTPDIAGAIGLGAAIDYVQSIGFENFIPHEEALLQHATEKPGGHSRPADHRHRRTQGGVISFVIEEPPHVADGHWHAAGFAGNCRPHGPSLLPADHGPPAI